MEDSATQANFSGDGEELPHVLLFPFPGESHVSPSLHLGELLCLAGLRVTFLNTDHVHRLLLRRRPSAFTSDNPRLRFHTIQDGLPDDDRRQLHDFVAMEESMRANSKDALRDLIRGKEDPDGWPPVGCVIADGVLRMALEVGEEVGVPVIHMRTSSPCAFWAYHHLTRLMDAGVVPFADGADLDGAAGLVPGMEKLLRLRDLPAFCRKAKTADDPALRLVAAAATSTRRARGLVLNTFEELDPLVLSLIRSLYPNTFAVGPLHLHIRSLAAGQKPEPESESDRSCMEWLDSKPPRSVVYVSFGSAVVVNQENLQEFWHGLMGSGQNFLWVIRPDMLKDAGAGDGIPWGVEKVEAGARGRGIVVAWAPQEKVLGHGSVGCFVTHSGWSSTLESVAAGVPMVCWPLFSDQPVNSRFASEVWGVGIDMKDICDRAVIERTVREAMGGGGGGEKAVKLRRASAAMAWKAEESVGDGGASRRNLRRLVDHIISISALSE